MKKFSISRGFTLIELLIVIVIIGALAVAVFVALNPVKRLQDSRNARRTTDIDSIRTAINEYLVDNGKLPAVLSAGMPETQIGTSNGSGGSGNPSCAITSGKCNVTAISCADLTSSLASYLKSIPQDPIIGSSATTGYSVSVDANNTITVNNCSMEALPVIVQDTFARGNQIYWGTASDGHTWGADAASNAIFSINSNQGQVATAGTIVNGILGPAVSNGQVFFTGSTSSFSNSDFGALLRYTDNNNWYKAYIDGSNLLVRRMLTGTNTVLTQTPFAASGGTSYTLRFQIIGATLMARVWATSGSEPSTWMVTVSDNSFASGYAGLGTAGFGGTVSYTSFTAYQL